MAAKYPQALPEPNPTLNIIIAGKVKMVSNDCRNELSLVGLIKPPKK